jgi:hypothetical protein
MFALFIFAQETGILAHIESYGDLRNAVTFAAMNLAMKDTVNLDLSIRYNFVAD